MGNERMDRANLWGAGELTVLDAMEWGKAQSRTWEKQKAEG
jgi:hypothetical protein